MNNERARMGIYVVFVELIRPDGKVERIKLPAILTI